MTTRRFKRGDHVSWDSEAGRVSGRISRDVGDRVQRIHGPCQQGRTTVRDPARHDGSHRDAQGIGAQNALALMVDSTRARVVPGPGPIRGTGTVST